MRKLLYSLTLLLMMAPTVANATYDQVVGSVYQDGTTLYIASNVLQLGNLGLNPDEIYCYATTPPTLSSNTFAGYGATLHVPVSAMVSYFTAMYWNNFNTIRADAIEPQSVTISESEASVGVGQQLLLSASVTPSDATPNTVYWSSTNTAVATVSDDGTVTAVAGGECDIRATCVNRQAVCHVTVIPERVTITLNQNAAHLLPNHTLTLYATCSPIAVDLTVTSSNPAVALPRLVNGTIMVVGIAEGEATITVNAAGILSDPAECVITVCTEVGDVNCDGFANIADVSSMIDYLLGRRSETFSTSNADTDRNGIVNIADVSSLIDYLLSGAWPWTEPKPEDETFTANGVAFKMIGVQGGMFTMGATAEQGSDAGDTEKPAHEVSLSSYCIGETEVTQELWQAVMGTNPSYYTGDLQRPVEQVSWIDCQSFIATLNLLTGKNFRLPTEAEWEYAARGGNRSQGYKYAGSNNIGDVAWYGYSNIGTHSVATKAPNELGLYDMSGNAWELCQDYYIYNYYKNSPTVNPIGPLSGSSYLRRGGSTGAAELACRVSGRYVSFPTSTSSVVGLRLALDPEDSNKFRLSETVFTLFKGDRKTVQILNGDGDYAVTLGSDCVWTMLSDDSLTVTGHNEGLINLHVTNNATGAVAVLTVIVKERETQD